MQSYAFCVVFCAEEEKGKITQRKKDVRKKGDKRKRLCHEKRFGS